MTRVPKLILLLAFVFAAAGCDQWTKYQAVASLTHGLDRVEGVGPRIAHYLSEPHPMPRAAVTVVDGLWRFTYAENPGAAFSFLSNVWFGRWLLTAIGVLVVGVFFAWALRLRRPLPLLGAALILGGAIGNLFDRIRLGYVIDFVQWHYHDRFAWPVFNVADAWIVVGAVLLFLPTASARGCPRFPGPSSLRRFFVRFCARSGGIAVPMSSILAEKLAEKRREMRRERKPRTAPRRRVD
jgi:signal peptidase II